MAATDSIVLPPRTADLTKHPPFERLTVLRYVGGKPARWLCRCECGNETVVRASNLTCGVSTSCGCINRENLIARNTTHGKTKTP
jgi:hypothetical protein